MYAAYARQSLLSQHFFTSTQYVRSLVRRAARICERIGPGEKGQQRKGKQLSFEIGSQTQTRTQLEPASVEFEIASRRHRLIDKRL